MKALTAVLSFGLIAVCAAPAVAQQPQQSKDSSKSIPASARPPRGMCRIWIDGVPPAQQPASTDCPTAIKNKPSNGRVIFGDDFKDTTASAPKTTPPGAKGFQNVKPPVVLVPRRPPNEALR
jgi:hypothetical protein